MFSSQPAGTNIQLPSTTPIWMYTSPVYPYSADVPGALNVMVKALSASGSSGNVLNPPSPLCMTVTVTSSHPGAETVSVVLLSSPLFSDTLMLNEDDVFPEVLAGRHHSVFSVCASDQEPASVRISIN